MPVRNRAANWRVCCRYSHEGLLLQLAGLTHQHVQAANAVRAPATECVELAHEAADTGVDLRLAGQWPEQGRHAPGRQTPGRATSVLFADGGVTVVHLLVEGD